NTLVSTTIFIGGGPPPSTDSTPSVPNATYRSAGAFVQGEFHLGDRFTTVLGLRGQEVRAKTRETPGLTEPQIESVDRTVVGSANLLFAVSHEFNLIGAVGRGFRTPNIVELFFNGFTPEGQAFQQPNPDLKAETSVNVDVGFKWRRRNLYLEAFAYQNTIRNGIRIAATGDTTSTGFPVLQNVNVEQLRFRGVEVMAQVGLGAGFWVEGNYAHQSSKDVDDPANPVGDSYSDKVVGELSYRRPSGRFTLAYRIRHNGEQKDNVPTGSVIGPVLPAFTVHEVYGSLRLPDVARTRNTVSLTVRNLTNTLYAEFANTTGLFRPDPGRNVIVTWTTAF
ncbi:MAG: TonB-dependent receptor, partial [Gemmatimonadales bacterium]